MSTILKKMLDSDLLLINTFQQYHKMMKMKKWITTHNIFWYFTINDDTPHNLFSFSLFSEVIIYTLVDNMYGPNGPDAPITRLNILTT